MLASSASLLNIDIVILDVGELAPAKQIIAPRSQLASKVDVITAEIEHVDASVLKDIESTPGTRAAIHPSPSTIAVIQDKLEQKKYLRTNGCPVSEFVNVEPTIESIETTATQLGLPLMLKSRTLGYDGRGNFVVRTLDQATEALQVLANRPLYAEKWVPFIKEIAVMVNNICHLVIAPLRSHDPFVASRAQRVAESAIRTLQGAGVFGVEMFLMEDGTIYINEIAPRPHNSGHYTIEACYTSQYENHLRAILGLPLGSTALKVPSAVMLNIIASSTSMDPIQAFTTTALTIPGCTSPPAEKWDTSLSSQTPTPTYAPAFAPLLSALPIPSTQAEIDAYAPPSPVSGNGHPSIHPIVGIIMGSDSDLPTLLPAARVLDHFHIPYEAHDRLRASYAG
ncbi:phosphoribosylaminoimidazole carboxylase [Butyriboletus roseoflavus]|nr:phosphoribosylaminoimidazole carboxylase [Butyriboletus roseoflavus]